MSEIKKSHSKWLHIRLTEDDYNRIQSRFTASAYRKISEYARKVLLDKPIRVNYRNQSMDDFMTEMIALRGELNAIGNNYNQVVKRLHSLSDLPELKTWILLHESAQKILLSKVSGIKQKLDQFNDVWLQK